jgi:hypothetical protein
VLDELDTSMSEIPHDQRGRFMTLIEQRLRSPNGQRSPRTLTDANHQWLLPRGDIQLQPYLPPPMEQRVPLLLSHTPEPLEQRVTTFTPPLQRISDAPPIMQAPNPTQKRTLRISPRTHLRRTRTNTPGSVPRITPNAPWHLPIPPSTPMTPRRSSRLTTVPPCQTATRDTPR